MRTEIGTKPEAFAIQVVGDEAVISLYENPVEILREGLSPLGNKITAWSVDEYRLTVPMRPGLKASVQADLALWLAAAKAKEDITPARTVEERVTTVEETLDALSEVIL